MKALLLKKGCTKTIPQPTEQSNRTEWTGVHKYTEYFERK